MFGRHVIVCVFVDVRFSAGSCIWWRWCTFQLFYGISHCFWVTSEWHLPLNYSICSLADTWSPVRLLASSDSLLVQVDYKLVTPPRLHVTCFACVDPFISMGSSTLMSFLCRFTSTTFNSIFFLSNALTFISFSSFPTVFSLIHIMYLIVRVPAHWAQPVFALIQYAVGIILIFFLYITLFFHKQTSARYYLFWKYISHPSTTKKQFTDILSQQLACFLSISSLQKQFRLVDHTCPFQRLTISPSGIYKNHLSTFLQCIPFEIGHQTIQNIPFWCTIQSI